MGSNPIAESSCEGDVSTVIRQAADGEDFGAMRARPGRREPRRENLDLVSSRPQCVGEAETVALQSALFGK